MSEVYYLKLVTGEEIIGVIHRHGDTVAILDPMTLEYGENEGHKFIFMSRFNPFIEDKTVHLERKNIMFMRPVMKEVDGYYRSSLAHSIKVSDVDFKRGIKAATAMANRSIDTDDYEIELETVDDLDGIIGDETIH